MIPVAPDQAWQRSAECRDCHKEVYAAWAASDHAQAHRPVNAARDVHAFTPPRQFSDQGIDYRLAWENNRPSFVENRPSHPGHHYTADFVLGYRPLRQYIVPTQKGRYQATGLAYDPTTNQWFDVFGQEQRHPGEWGHWRGRGMNWNSMCAHCHLTSFHKNYHAGTDSYASVWLEHGVGCVQCHGGITTEHRIPSYRTSATQGLPLHLDRKRMQETCAPCHARNELLTDSLKPGAIYTDNYRLTLPTDPTVFYPDGQVRDEDFNYTSLLTSRMGGIAGVTCLDCHDPHTGKTRLPATDNSLCQQCHAPPGRVMPGMRVTAPAIDPVAHSHHQPDSPGNRCIDCHMPTTTYMQRDPRHDHGFLKPDPLLTRELGIPNACNRCHADKSTDWAITAADQWYGGKLDSRQRTRARVVAAAQRAEDGASAKLVALLETEDVPAWKAVLLQLSVPLAARDPRLREIARTALGNPEPMIRSAAVQVLGALPEEREPLRPLLHDRSRLVRLDVEWALSDELTAGAPERLELERYLDLSADQPLGQLRKALDLFNRHHPEEAVEPLRKAIAWDPNSPAFYETLGVVLDGLGRSREAGAALWEGALAIPQNADLAFQAGLAFATAGKSAEAEKALRESTRRDPRSDRSWYNLGLLLAQTDRAEEAIAALQKAESLAPQVADYSYARATILLQRGDHQAAIAALRRVLAIDPRHAGARSLLAVPASGTRR